MKNNFDDFLLDPSHEDLDKLHSDAQRKLLRSGGKKKKKKKSMYKSGGAKPDYLDFDKDGNKKESMKSALKSKKKLKRGGMKY